jgi:hypothetical protein
MRTLLWLTGAGVLVALVRVLARRSNTQVHRINQP